jgi:hypothetical protein
MWKVRPWLIEAKRPGCAMFETMSAVTAESC